MNDVFAFQLAVAAKATGMELHAYCVMANHFHLVVTDPYARLPEFMQELDSVVARAVNALYGRDETFWRPGSYGAIPLETEEDIVRKVVYVLANPVTARLVRRARMWPGLWSAPRDFGSTRMVRRPAHFFSPLSPGPDELPLELKVPKGCGAAEAFRAVVEASLMAREEEVARESPWFLGAARVMRQNPHAVPRSREPRWKLNPKVVAKDPGLRKELLQQLRAFLAAYRNALLVWRAGKAEPVFPEGTYLMRVAHGVACAGAG